MRRVTRGYLAVLRMVSLSTILIAPPYVWAQSASVSQNRSPAATLKSPEVASDRRVTFQLNAPAGNSVTVSGDFWTQQNRVENLTKGSDGIWRLTTDPLEPGLYSYVFTLDGVPIPDPSNGDIKPGVRTTQSTFLVPGPEAEYLEEADVPHGDIRIEYYKSNVTGKTRRMYIYLPPGYEKGTIRYPVAYLFHGGGDDESAWYTVGRANFIMDNLIAHGKAKPMILIMPTLWQMDPADAAAHAAENEELIKKALVQDMIPFVDRNFRTLPGAAHRAVGGLGLGRNMFPEVLWSTMSNFGYAFFVSGGAGPQVFDALQRQNPGVLADPANVKRLKVFMGDGANDSSVQDSHYLSEQLTKRGYNVTRYETTGTHGWSSFRQCFAEFAKVAFQ